MSGDSLDGVLEWPSELWVTEEPDCLESRPAVIGSWRWSILKEGIEGLREELCGGGLRYEELVGGGFKSGWWAA